MKLSFFRLRKEKTRKTISDYKREMLIKHGSEQFKTLIKKGLGIPVALL